MVATVRVPFRRTCVPRWRSPRGQRCGLNVLLLVLAVTARAQPPGSLQPTMDDALVVLEVHLGDTQLSDALEAQEIDGELYLPLARFAAALSLAIECDASQATATGFVLAPARSFHLDAHAGTVTIAGTTTNFDTSQIRLGADDIYVAHALISTWLPVDLQVDLPSLWLTVRPREPLPINRAGSGNVRRKRWRVPAPWPVTMPKTFRAAPRPMVGSRRRRWIRPSRRSCGVTAVGRALRPGLRRWPRRICCRWRPRPTLRRPLARRTPWRG